MLKGNKSFQGPREISEKRKLNKTLPPPKQQQKKQAIKTEQTNKKTQYHQQNKNKTTKEHKLIVTVCGNDIITLFIPYYWSLYTVIKSFPREL